MRGVPGHALERRAPRRAAVEDAEAAAGEAAAVGGSTALGTSPSSMIRFLNRRRDSVGTDESSACVYGWSGFVEELVGRRDLDDLAEVHDRDPVGHVAHDRHVVADEEVGQAEALLQIAQQVQDLRSAPRRRAR